MREDTNGLPMRSGACIYVIPPDHLEEIETL
jgi:hypothetical protein